MPDVQSRQDNYGFLKDEASQHHYYHQNVLRVKKTNNFQINQQVLRGQILFKWKNTLCRNEQKGWGISLSETEYQTCLNIVKTFGRMSGHSCGKTITALG